MPLFFISSTQVQNGRLAITGELANHVRASLRTQAGEYLWLCDERQRRYRLHVDRITKHELAGQIVEEQQRPSPTHPPLILAAAILKGERMEWLIQKATELGVQAILPLITRFGIVRPQSSRIAAQLSRWQRIALEAAQQSEQWLVPTIHPPSSFEDLRGRLTTPSCRLMLVERSGGQRIATLPLPQGSDYSIYLIIGPEGGWSPEEIKLANQADFTLATLGEKILRAETAAIAAVSILQHRLGELG